MNKKNLLTIETKNDKVNVYLDGVNLSEVMNIPEYSLTCFSTLIKYKLHQLNVNDVTFQEFNHYCNGSIQTISRLYVSQKDFENLRKEIFMFYTIGNYNIDLILNKNYCIKGNIFDILNYSEKLLRECYLYCIKADNVSFSDPILYWNDEQIFDLNEIEQKYNDIYYGSKTKVINR